MNHLSLLQRFCRLPLSLSWRGDGFDLTGGFECGGDLEEDAGGEEGRSVDRSFSSSFASKDVVVVVVGEELFACKLSLLVSGKVEPLLLLLFESSTFSVTISVGPFGVGVDLLLLLLLLLLVASFVDLFTVKNDFKVGRF